MDKKTDQSVLRSVEKVRHQIKQMLLLLAFLLLISCTVSAEAEEKPEAERGREALIATGHAQFLQFPEEEDYLPEWKTLYARKAFHAPCLEVKAVPDQYVMGRNMPYLYEGTAVTVVAEQGEMSCIIYKGSSNKPYCGWIKSIRLLDEFPGSELVSGTELSLENTTIRNDVDSAWGEPGYQKFWQPYIKLSEQVTDCIGFTLEYQMIAENTDKWGNIFGDRVIKICDGEEWIEVGRFPYPEQGTVKIQVWLKKPMTITAVSTIAQCEYPDVPTIRQEAYQFITTN